MAKMSKRTVILIVLGVVFLAALLLTNFGRNLPWLPGKMQVLTEEIPSSRPIRRDWKELDRFAGQSMDRILEVLKAEKEARPDPTRETEEPLGLPDAPLPFPDDASVANEENLRAFVTIQQGSAQEPTLLDRWKFNLALDALNVSPEQIPEAIRMDTRPEPESDTFPVRLKNRAVEGTGAFAVGNFDDDPGLEMISDGGNKIWKVDGDALVETPRNPLSTVPGDEILPADFDADGDLDLLLIRGDGFPNSLLRNNGDEGFDDVTIGLGLLSFSDTTCAAWLDYDNDGRLDLLVGNSDHPLELYHQSSGGGFQPIAWDLGLWVHRGMKGIEVADFSGDGNPDFFLSIEDQSDRLCISRPAANWDAWSFPDVATDAGVSGSDAGSIARAFDFDNDGAVDLLIGDPDVAESGIRLYQNGGGEDFRDVTRDTGLTTVKSAISFGIVDCNNDGFEDIAIGTPEFEMNRLFLNGGGYDFNDVSVVSESSYLDAPEKCITTDLDGDGMADLISRNKHNQIRRLECTGGNARWLDVRLTGNSPGTRLKLVVRDEDWILHTIRRTLRHSSRMLIGLGEADTVESIDVLPPESDEPLKTIGKVTPNESVTIDLPARPKQRPVVPLSEDSVETAAK